MAAVIVLIVLAAAINIYHFKRRAAGDIDEMFKDQPQKRRGNPDRS